MDRFALFAALSAMSALAFAQEVGHTCVDGCGSAPPPSTQSAPSAPAAPSQQDIMNQQIMNGVQQGVTQAIGEWKQQRQREQDQRQANIQQQQQEQRQQILQEGQREAQRRQQRRSDVVGEMMPLPGEAPESMPTAFTHPIKAPVIKVDYPNAARREHQAMMCGLKAVFAYQNQFGPDEKKQFDDFRKQIGDFRVALAAPPSGDKKDDLVLRQGFQTSAQARDSRQLIADVVSVRHGDDGMVSTIIDYHYSANGKAVEGRSVITSDKYGRVQDNESDKSTRQCLAKID